MSLLCAEYDPSRAHGQVEWRVHRDLPVIEIVNNWECRTFEETYRPPLVLDRMTHVLRALQPDVVHIHNLLNLSFDLPLVARTHGIAVVATLHDYALVCPSGGQRIHQDEHHVCHSIDTERCVRCFRGSPIHAQLSFARVSKAVGSSTSLRQTAASLVRAFPRLAGSMERAIKQVRPFPVTSREIEERLGAARNVFDHIDLFVAPSHSMASEFVRLGIPRAKIRVRDYGFVTDLSVQANLQVRSLARPRASAATPLRIGFVGTLVWHKGVHVLMQALRRLPPTGFELKVYGSPDVFPAYAARLRSEAEGLPVRFMGAFSRDHIDEVYGQLDILVVPSLWLENSPLVIHEAYMAGVPVVAAEIGGIPELVEAERTGLLYEPDDPAALASALQRLIEHPHLLQQLTEAVRERAPVRSIDEDAREWGAIYQGFAAVTPNVTIA